MELTSTSFQFSKHVLHTAGGSGTVLGVRYNVENKTGMNPVLKDFITQQQNQTLRVFNYNKA